MNAVHDSILSIIKDATPQNPVAAAWMYDYCKATEQEIDKALEDLYALAKVNRCKHTKLGITDMVYWPTGVTKVVPDYGRDGTPEPSIRNYVVKKQPLQILPSNKPTLVTGTPIMINADQINGAEAEIIIKPDTASTVENTDKTVLKANTLETMLSHLIKCGPTSAKELAVLIGEKYAGNIPGRLNYLATGDDAIVKCKKTQSGNSYPVYTYEMLPGKTLQDFYDRKFVRATKKATEEKAIDNKVQADTILSEQETTNEEFEIPAFLPNNQTNEDLVYTTTDFVNEFAIENPTDAELQCEIEVCIEMLLPHLPVDCHMTLRHPYHQNIQVEIDGTLLAHPMLVNLDKLGAVFGAIKTLQDGAAN